MSFTRSHNNQDQLSSSVKSGGSFKMMMGPDDPHPPMSHSRVKIHQSYINLLPILPELDTWVSSKTFIHLEQYKSWLDGHGITEACVILHPQMEKRPGFKPEALLQDVMDNHRIFYSLEKYLHTPNRLPELWTYQLEPAHRQALVYMYYDFDPKVMREFLGKKLSSRQRKDLDEVSEKTEVNLKSCRRQFDNLKRISKTVEELNGCMLQNIQSQFSIPADLAKKYLTVLFINANRFETNKKKLQYLTFCDFYRSAGAMQKYWKSSTKPTDEYGIELDREFLMDLRDLRALLDREKEHRILVCKVMKGKVTEKIFGEIDHNFRQYSRTLINLGHGLNHNKDLKDLFIDLVEKYIEPCKQLKWSAADIEFFLQVYTNAATHIDILKSKTALKATWKNYMEGMTWIILALYHA